MRTTAFRPIWVTLVGLAAALALGPSAQAASCPAPGQWIRQGEPVAADALFGELAERDVVLLGEQHDRMDHHRWQLHTLAGLHARRPDMVIGLEMLPREAQPALDAWVAGELDEADFLERSDWRVAWGYDPEFYLPILHFARLHRVPLRALNITPELRGRLVDEGWEGVPEEERFAISAPAEAPAAYREQLAELYAHHPSQSGEAGLERFVAAQLAWDRAMAAGLAEAHEEAGLVVGLIGQGHLRDGHGVPHQLRDLGIEASSALLPWEVNEAECQAPPVGAAEAVFTLADRDPEAAAPMQLGVYIVPHADGVEVHRIVDGSIAERAGLQEGDVILQAAGEALERPAELTARVRRQPPGTLLPLQVRRDGHEQEILARFTPASP